MIKIFFLSVSCCTYQGLLHLSFGAKMKLMQRNFLGRKVYYAVHGKYFCPVQYMFGSFIFQFFLVLFSAAIIRSLPFYCSILHRDLFVLQNFRTRLYISRRNTKCVIIEFLTIFSPATCPMTSWSGPSWPLPLLRFLRSRSHCQRRSQGSSETSRRSRSAWNNKWGNGHFLRSQMPFFLREI